MAANLQDPDGFDDAQWARERQQKAFNSGDVLKGLFDLLKAGHEGLTPIQETVTRDGQTFQETFWRRTGQQYSPERTDYQMQVAPPPTIMGPTGKPARGVAPQKKATPEAATAKKQKEEGQAIQTYDGKLPPTMSTQEHVAVARQVLDQHEANLEASKTRLKSLAPPGATIQGRVKDLSSTMGKLVRKPKYGNATALQDLTGMRVLCNSAEEQMATVAKIKQRYPVVTEDDYLTKPQGHYRAYHLIIQDDDGFQKEIQVQTQAQQSMQVFLHDVYKPLNPMQEAAVQQFKPDIDNYANAAFQYTLAADAGLVAPKPECPAVVAALFNCI